MAVHVHRYHFYLIVLHQVGTLAVDGWARLAVGGGDWAGQGPAQSLFTVPNVTAHPSTASVST